MIQLTVAEGRAVRSSLARVTERVTEKVTERVTDAEKAILELLIEDPAYTYSVLAEKLGMSRKSVSTKIKSLKEKGLMRRIGSDTKGYWEIS